MNYHYILPSYVIELQLSYVIELQLSYVIGLQLSYVIGLQLSYVIELQLSYVISEFRRSQKQVTLFCNQVVLYYGRIARNRQI